MWRLLVLLRHYVKYSGEILLGRGKLSSVGLTGLWISDNEPKAPLAASLCLGYYLSGFPPCDHRSRLGALNSFPVGDSPDSSKGERVMSFYYEIFFDLLQVSAICVE
jgi:hypothetical protein